MFAASPATKYELKKKREAARQRKNSAAGRDIGEIPPVADPKRRAKGERSLKAFCEIYLAQQFPLKWSRAHLRALAILEDCTRHGGQFAFAMARGSGKTTLARAAAIWAAFYGLHRYIVLIAATEKDARKILRAIKRIIEGNALLKADFPEIVFPIAALENVKQRAPGQLYKNQPTNLAWKEDGIQFATLEGFTNTGGIIETIGLTGSIRGRSHQREDGESIRPTFVLVDDPQTKASAKSDTQCLEREETIKADVLGLVGPGETLSLVVTCTIIREGDLASRLLDHDLNPEFQGELSGILDKMPTNEKLWQEYAEIRAASFAAGGKGREATAFYKKNRKAMDAGALPSWPQRFNPGQLSAIQFAMDLRCKDERAFWSEYQNQPLTRDTVASVARPEQIQKKINHLPRLLLPADAQLVTAFIDVHLTALYYVVCAWSPGSTGAVIDYGTWPEQPQRYFALTSITRTIQGRFAGKPEAEQLRAALDQTAQRIIGQPYRTADGLELSPAICMVDSGWGEHTKTVFEFCRQSPYRSQLMPSKGRAIGPAEKPFSEWKVEPGERVGESWYVGRPEKYKAQQLCTFDPNYWKSKIHRGFILAADQPGTITLFGADGREHELFADHLNGEAPTETYGRGRRVDVWRQLPSRPDQHWLDGIVGCAAGASVRGLARPMASPIGDTNQPQKPKRKAQRLMRG